MQIQVKGIDIMSGANMNCDVEKSKQAVWTSTPQKYVHCADMIKPWWNHDFISLPYQQKCSIQAFTRI